MGPGKHMAATQVTGIVPKLTVPVLKEVNRLSRIILDMRELLGHLALSHTEHGHAAHTSTILS